MHEECRAIFGEERLLKASELGLEYLLEHSAAIGAAARLLLQFNMNPERQAEVINRLPEPVAIGLCRWLLEPQLLSKLGIMKP